MIAVLDASAAIRIVGDGRKSLRDAAEGADFVITPDLFIAETCNAFRKYARAKVLSYDKTAALTREAIELIDRFYPLDELLEDVLALAPKIPSSAYDLFYISLARRTRAILLTADHAMYQAAGTLGIPAITAE